MIFIHIIDTHLIDKYDVSFPYQKSNDSNNDSKYNAFFLPHILRLQHIYKELLY